MVKAKRGKKEIASSEMERIFSNAEDNDNM